MTLSPTWRRRLFLGATVLSIVLLSAHPELRLFVPIVDAFGVDLFVLLVGAQLWDYARPMAHWARDNLAIPVVRESYDFAILMLGCMGPFVDASLAQRFGRRGSLLPA
jgi:hypothetical protein